MKILFDHPRKSKWKLYAFNGYGYGSDPNKIKITAEQPMTWENGKHKEHPTLWVRNNFIFDATLRLQYVADYRSGLHAWYEDVEEPYRVFFVSSGFNEIIQLVREGKIGSQAGHIITGRFTFRKQGASCFCEVYHG